MSADLRHPHRPSAPIPVQIDVERLRECSRIDQPRALLTLLGDWLIIATAIFAALRLDHPLVTALAIVVIGARQHALTVIVHDAAHFRFLANRRLNDWVADLFAAWPVFISVRLFRLVHGPHHRFTGEPGDGNRRGWRTHDEDGQLRPAWVFPKTPLGLVATLVRRALLVAGVIWILRGLLAPFVLRRPIPELLARIAYYGGVAWLTTVLGLWPELLLFWILPCCTWHMFVQYTRLICEHSGRIGDQPGFTLTRSTLPSPLGRLLVLPHHIGYHIEHHWFPSVPWYRLPDLHAALRADPAFAAANVQRSVLGSLRQCVRDGDG
jgi:fatty acid desaturase